MSNGQDAPAADVRRFETCGRAWIAGLRHVWSAGEAGMADRGPVIEGPPLLFEIASVSRDDPILREHGDRAGLAGPGRPAGGRTRPDGPADGASGGARPDAEQVRWVVDLLRSRPWTTSAWIPLTTPGEPAGAPPAPTVPAPTVPASTVPAPTVLAFRIRGYRLITTAMFRAQNVHRAYLAYLPLREVQVHVADRLGLPSGPLRVFVDVPHLHVADADRVAGILAAQPESNAA
ncbi:thymidylate synthase family protein [Actinomadura sediminis]|uniref:Thymidylate synthase/dCMP hydroxymethylase domain-containing protein n=1 Tax=Actinomadura sediminis TaxID=1038904 RepID=A0ABW3EZQ1_9ACTN